ncbi:MAG: porin [Acetobacteraceae bacterium]|nr:porin [Acetobacteraceae bacterium]
MRKMLLAGAAVIGAAAWQQTAYAQPASLPVSPTQGAILTTPSASPPAGANNNNNTATAFVPGAVANPTPGSMVIHINGRVTTELNAGWSSIDNGSFPAVTGAGGITLSPAGNFKLQPTNITNYARIYTGVDAMAANGLRYGGAIEIRENFTGQSSSSSSTGSSGYSSSQTLYVRRAFGYIAADNVGILRFGQGDGLIGLYDNGITTFQFLPSSNLGGGDLQAALPASTTVPFSFMSLQGNEYGNSKLVYLSPQFYGVDFGVQWAPNTANGYANGSPTSYGTVTGCNFGDSGCSSLSSSTIAADGSRILNQTAVGARYQHTFGPVGLLAYGVYEFSGHANYTGPVVTTPTNGGGTGRFDSLSFGNAGVAVTYSGFTVGGNWVGGAVNGAGALRPSGGSDEEGWLVGATYKSGPLVVGAVGESIDSQGSPAMVGKTQRHEYAIDAGASYVIAPGLVGWAEYLYQDRKQSGFNFVTSSPGSAYNTVQSQALELGTTVYW